MVNIGSIYIKENNLFTVEQSIRDYANDDLCYYLCYNVKLAEYEVYGIKGAYGTNKAYEKLGRPFVFSKEEIEECEELSLKCKDCLYFSNLEFKGDNDCHCSQHLIDWSPRYVRLIPCDLYRHKDKPYIKTKCDEEEIKTIFDKIFSNCRFVLSDIQKDGASYKPLCGFMGGDISKEEFDEVFGVYKDSTVTVIKPYPSNIDHGKFVESPYSIPATEFDYSFYNHECKVTYCMFLFRESRKVVFICYENVYIFDI